MTKRFSKSSRRGKNAANRARARQKPKSKPGAITNSLWQSFRTRFPGHTAFEKEEIYAIPRPLIELLDKQLHLFSAAEMDFEIALASEAGVGFAFEIPIPLNVVTRELAPGFVPNSAEWDRSVRASQEIQQLLDNDLRADRRAPSTAAGC
jgi:hypothetical protein